METKHLNALFDIKEVTDEGTFEGLASVYGVVDEGGDVVEKGAFTRTVKARPEVPILWRHDQPIGKGQVVETDKGLFIKGRLTLAVTQAKEALALMKDGVVKGLSIGFQSIPSKEEIKNGIRHLNEVKLWEVSLTPFPMNPAARITDVKQRGSAREQKDFAEELDRIEVQSGHYMKMQALSESLYDCMYMDGDGDVKGAEAAKCIDQFKESYMEWFPRYMALRDMMYGKEIKEGRKLSAATREKIEAALADHRSAIEKLQALLDDGSEPEPEPAAKSVDPVPDHSKLSQLIEQAKGEFTWKH